MVVAAHPGKQHARNPFRSGRVGTSPVSSRRLSGLDPLETQLVAPSRRSEVRELPFGRRGYQRFGGRREV